MHAKLLETLKDADIIDISHDIKLNNIVEASFIINQIQKPENQSAITLVRIGSTPRSIIYQHQGNWYILPDNGLISLVFELKKTDKVYEIANEEIPEAIRLISDNKLNGFSRIEDYVIRIQKKPIIQDQMVITERIYTDRWGNCFFNLTRDIFDGFFNEGRFSAKIQYVRDTSFYKISEDYNDVNPGDSLLMFSNSGYLKLAINQGSASQLFRIKENSQIIFHKL